MQSDALAAQDNYYSEVELLQAMKADGSRRAFDVPVEELIQNAEQWEALVEQGHQLEDKFRNMLGDAEGDLLKKQVTLQSLRTEAGKVIYDLERLEYPSHEAFDLRRAAISTEINRLKSLLKLLEMYEALLNQQAEKQGLDARMQSMEHKLQLYQQALEPWKLFKQEAARLSDEFFVGRATLELDQLSLLRDQIPEESGWRAAADQILEQVQQRQKELAEWNGVQDKNAELRKQFNSEDENFLGKVEEFYADTSKFVAARFHTDYERMMNELRLFRFRHFQQSYLEILQTPITWTNLDRAKRILDRMRQEREELASSVVSQTAHDDFRALELQFTSAKEQLGDDSATLAREWIERAKALLSTEAEDPRVALTHLDNAWQLLQGTPDEEREELSAQISQAHEDAARLLPIWLREQNQNRFDELVKEYIGRTSNDPDEATDSTKQVELEEPDIALIEDELRLRFAHGATLGNGAFDSSKIAQALDAQQREQPVDGKVLERLDVLQQEVSNLSVSLDSMGTLLRLHAAWQSDASPGSLSDIIKATTEFLQDDKVPAPVKRPLAPLLLDYLGNLEVQNSEKSLSIATILHEEQLLKPLREALSALDNADS